MLISEHSLRKTIRFNGIFVIRWKLRYGLSVILYQQFKTKSCWYQRKYFQLNFVMTIIIKALSHMVYYVSCFWVSILCYMATHRLRFRYYVLWYKRKSTEKKNTGLAWKLNYIRVWPAKPLFIINKPREAVFFICNDFLYFQAF